MNTDKNMGMKESHKGEWNEKQGTTWFLLWPLTAHLHTSAAGSLLFASDYSSELISHHHQVPVYV